jgi:hypothetical protein
MSWFSTLSRAALLGLAVAGPLLLAGCSSFRPVYGDNGIANARLELAYGKPGTRLDQVVYQEFVLRFGRSSRADAPLLTVTTSASGRGLTTTNIVKPATQQAVTVTVNAVLTTADGRRIFAGSRNATAQYVSVGQTLADAEAGNEAQERAAREAAEGLRLAILGALATPIPDA